ncbi:hypothetical protein RCL1_006737 [Eukaryota sp. TZLM3-RCL]
MSSLYFSEDGLPSCPCCITPLDAIDLSHKCTCGFRVCSFCLQRIRDESNPRCPACRKPLEENLIELTSEQVQEILKQHPNIKTTDKPKKKEASSLKSKPLPTNLADMRVVTKNLVYLVGLPCSIARESTLLKFEYLGQYGSIKKVMVNVSRIVDTPVGPTVSAYLTFESNHAAALASYALDGVLFEGYHLKASFGTTKYCSFFLRGHPCSSPSCLYLHNIADDHVSFTKTQMNHTPGSPFYTAIRPNEQSLFNNIPTSDTCAYNGLFAVHAKWRSCFPPPYFHGRSLKNVSSVVQEWIVPPEIVPFLAIHPSNRLILSQLSTSEIAQLRRVMSAPVVKEVSSSVDDKKSVKNLKVEEKKEEIVSSIVDEQSNSTIDLETTTQSTTEEITMPTIQTSIEENVETLDVLDKTDQPIISTESTTFDESNITVTQNSVQNSDEIVFGLFGIDLFDFDPPVDPQQSTTCHFQPISRKKAETTTLDGLSSLKNSNDPQSSKQESLFRSPLETSFKGFSWANEVTFNIPVDLPPGLSRSSSSYNKSLAKSDSSSGFMSSIPLNLSMLTSSSENLGENLDKNRGKDSSLKLDLSGLTVGKAEDQGSILSLSEISGLKTVEEVESVIVLKNDDVINQKSTEVKPTLTLDDLSADQKNTVLMPTIDTFVTKKKPKNKTKKTKKGSKMASDDLKSDHFHTEVAKVSTRSKLFHDYLKTLSSPQQILDVLEEYGISCDFLEESGSEFSIDFRSGHSMTDFEGFPAILKQSFPCLN